MNLTSFIVMDVLERALEMERAGEKVVHMEVGEPDFPVAPVAVEEAAEAVRRGLNSYSPSFGIPELREAISRHYRDRYGVEVDPARIFVTPGSSPALMAVMRMLAEEYGDEVIYTDPGYPCYKNMARFLGLKERPLPVYEEEGFKLLPDRIEGRGILVLNFPANPTGVSFSRDELEAVVKRAKELGLGIVSDEIYHGIEYGEPAPTVLEFAGDAVVVGGFSKFFAATGWRLGWVIVPEEKVRLFQCIAQNLFICAPTPLQHAAVRCFSPEAIKVYRGYVEEYRRRRDYLVERLKDMGFGVSYLPQGAFYLFVRVDAFTRDSYSFAMRALEEAKVAITPGVDFGSNRTELYVRFSYATSMEDIELAMDRLSRWLGGPR